MPLLLLTVPPTTTSVTHVGAVDLDDPQPDLAVVDQDRVARADVAGQALVRRASRSSSSPGDVAGGDRERVARRRARPGRRRTCRAGSSGPAGRRRCRPPCPVVVGGLPHQPVDLLVVGVAAVAEVEPGDVHAGVDELADPLRGRGRRAEGADDLCSTHGSTLAAAWNVPTTAVRSVDPSSEATRSDALRRRAGARSAGSGPGRVVEPVRYASTAAAAARPSAIAQTISDWPRPASPATKTPSTEDA